MVKNPPANAGDTETWVQCLGREDPLEEGMALQCSCLENPMDRRTYSPWGQKELDTTEVTKHACVHMHTHTHW